MNNKNSSGNNLQSSLLQQPDTALPLIIQCAEFCKKAYDPEYGGYFTMLGRDGMPKPDGHPICKKNYKTVFQQSRIAFSFTKAYMATGNKEYLEYARWGLDFLERYGLDRKNGGFYIILDAAGKCIDKAARRELNVLWGKWSLIQHYGLIGFGAFYEATHDENCLAEMLRLKQDIDGKLWDSRPGYEGYYEWASYDWTKQGGKGFAPTVDAITAHALALMLHTGADSHRERLLDLAEQIIQHIVPSMDQCRLGMVEYYDSDWLPLKWPLPAYFMFGHSLKTAWCLGRIFLIHPDERYLKAAEKLLSYVWEKGWDHEYGGIYYGGNHREDKITHDEKQYWTFEQAVTAGLIWYYITNNTLYLKMADLAMDYFSAKLWDPVYGDAFDKIDRTGTKILGEDKGNFYKDIYHTLELHYFVYLYGNLYLHKRPVTLYYSIEPAPVDRELLLNPIEIREDEVQIQNVWHEGREFTAFDARQRLLKVPAGVGGEFKVMFGPKI
jgi:N-acylglucosamine 2-epimerase